MARMRPLGSAPRSSTVAGLDIGSGKISCLIAAVEPDASDDHGFANLRALGFGHQRSAGIERGCVVDLERARDAVTAAVAQAEQTSRVRVERVHVAADFVHPRTSLFRGHVDLSRGIVRQADIAALSSGARAFACREGGVLLRLARASIGLDGGHAVANPVGMAASSLHAEHHAVVVDEAQLRNLCLLIESCHLDLAGIEPAAHASALSATTEDERRLGVICLDIGAGVTSLAGFHDCQMLLHEAWPVGGADITHDLAAELDIPLAEAERIKTLYGTVAVSPSDEHEFVRCAVARPDEAQLQHTTRARIARIVRRRMSDTLELVRDRVDRDPSRDRVGARVVLTGGASQVPGLDLLARDLLSRRVRLSAVPALNGPSGGVLGPQFSSVIGVCLRASRLEAGRMDAGWQGEIAASDGRGGYVASGYLGRVERWLRESF
jgi:cell division protein FtsA